MRLDIFAISGRPVASLAVQITRNRDGGDEGQEIKSLTMRKCGRGRKKLVPESPPMNSDRG